MSGSERLVVVGGAGLVVASVVPWYRAEPFAFEPDRTNGWQEPDALLSQSGIVIGAVVAVAVLVASGQRSRPRVGSRSWGTALTAGSAVAAGLIALKFALNMGNTTVGVYLALAAVATQLYGAYVTHITDTGASAPTRGGRSTPLRPDPPASPAAPSGAGPSLSAPHPGSPGAPAMDPRAWAAAWPETAYLLREWLRPGTDPTAALAAYRARFVADPARVDRLVAELGTLLDPARSETERTSLVAAVSPHLVGGEGGALLAWLLRTLTRPAPPTNPFDS